MRPPAEGEGQRLYRYIKIYIRIRGNTNLKKCKNCAKSSILFLLIILIILLVRKHMNRSFSEHMNAA